MKIPFYQSTAHPYSIIQSVIDGTLAVQSVTEFKDILEIYPNDPSLQRKYGDLLLENKRPKEAFEAFGLASRRFIDNGMNLQAVVSKILQWRIRKPTHDEGRRFHRRLNQNDAQHTPLQRFWANLDYPELVAVMRRLIRVRLIAGQKIERIDAPSNDIYFVVSGNLAETISPDCQIEAARAGIETEPMLLGANDLIGHIFPLAHPTRSAKEVTAVHDVELVKLSKSILKDIQRKFPNIVNLLSAMYKSRNTDKCDRIWQTVRRTARHDIRAKVEFPVIQPMGGPKDGTQAGTTVDLSVGGACVDLGSLNAIDAHGYEKGAFVHLSVELAEDAEAVNLAGKIMWRRKSDTSRQGSTLIGIRFDGVNAADRDLISDYCLGNATARTATAV